jgi:hypothetical protein
LFSDVPKITQLVGGLPSGGGQGKKIRVLPVEHHLMSVLEQVFFLGLA